MSAPSSDVGFEPPANVALDQQAGVASGQPASFASDQPASFASDQPASFASDQPASFALDQPASFALDQPASFAFDADSEARIPAILARYPAGKQASAVMPLLYLAQGQVKRQTGSAWVPRAAMDAVAERLGMPPIRVYEVASFYFMFNLRPIGKVHLQLCGTTPCMLRGSDEVLRACRDAARVKIGGTSADGVFTLTEVECLGACVNAPVLQVDDDYYEDLDYARTVALIEALRRGERPAPGSTIGRQASAPEGGPLTLLETRGD